MRSHGSFLGRLFLFLFYAHLLLIAFLVIFLIIRTNHSFPKTWYFPLFSSTAFAGILGFASQSFIRLHLSITFRSAFWLSPVLTSAFGLFLVSVETPAGLAASIVALISSILQSLYACWASPRFHHSCNVLAVSTAFCPPKVRTAVLLSLVVATLYSSFLMCGIIGATMNMKATRFNLLFVFILLVSLTWTMEIIKNVLQVTVSHVLYMEFTFGVEIDYMAAVTCAARSSSLGRICIGSITVPFLSTLHGLARAVSLISGDVDEFMFSCTDCCSGVASSTVACANRWGFVYVGVYGKEIKQASTATWEMFQRAGMEKVIDSDLTSSLCFLCGMASGSACALIAGIPVLLMHKVYATEVAVYAFLMGYFLNRVGMAWVQSSVAAYYVSYAENPQGQQFDATIPNYILDLQTRSQE